MRVKGSIDLEGAHGTVKASDLECARRLPDRPDFR